MPGPSLLVTYPTCSAYLARDNVPVPDVPDVPDIRDVPDEPDPSCPAFGTGTTFSCPGQQFQPAAQPYVLHSFQ